MDSIISTTISKEHSFIMIQYGNSASGNRGELKCQNLRIRQVISETTCSSEILSSDSCFARLVIYPCKTEKKMAFFLNCMNLSLYVPRIYICNIAHFSCH